MLVSGPRSPIRESKVVVWKLLTRGPSSVARRLKEATEAEKKAIKEKMDAQIKAFEAQQSLLHKQIRDEQRRQKQTPKER